MISKEKMQIVNEYSDEILELIDNREEFTRSDLQGIVEALVMKILKDGGKKWLKAN